MEAVLNIFSRGKRVARRDRREWFLRGHCVREHLVRFEHRRRDVHVDGTLPAFRRDESLRGSDDGARQEGSHVADWVKADASAQRGLKHGFVIAGIILEVGEELSDWGVNRNRRRAGLLDDTGLSGSKDKLEVG